MNLIDDYIDVEDELRDVDEMDWSNLRLKSHQTQMWLATQGYEKRLIGVCGRRTGKTVFATARIRQAAYAKKGQVIYYVGPTYEQARNIVWKNLRDGIAKPHIKEFSKKDLYIRLVNDSEIFLRSGEAIDSSVGTSVNLLVIDEAGIQNEDVPKYLIPSLGTTGGNMIAVTTPRGRDHWTYDYYQMAFAKDARGNLVHPDWSSVTVTTGDAGFYPQKLIDEARDVLDTKTFNQEYNASFENSGGTIYYAFSKNYWPEGNIDSSIEFDPSKWLYIGMDFNVDPLTAVLAQQHGDEVWVFDEIYLRDSNTTEASKIIRTRFPQHRIYVCPDATGGRRTTSADGNTDHLILQQNGFLLLMDRTPSGFFVNPEVVDRIADVNSALCSATGKRRVRIHPRCANLINSINRQEYKANTRNPDKSSGFDHMNDAFGYLIHQLFPSIIKRRSRSSSMIRVI
jgi:hypothetical protein